MEYTFGYLKDKEILKTKGDAHSDLKGLQNVKVIYPDCEITDTFFVVEKYDSKEDEDGNCYDWYFIKNHNRIIDKTQALQSKITENQDAIFDLASIISEMEVK